MLSLLLDLHVCMFVAGFCKQHQSCLVITLCPALCSAMCTVRCKKSRAVHNYGVCLQAARCLELLGNAQQALEEAEIALHYAWAYDLEHFVRRLRSLASHRQRHEQRRLQHQQQSLAAAADGPDMEAMPDTSFEQQVAETNEQSAGLCHHDSQQGHRNDKQQHQQHQHHHHHHHEQQQQQQQQQPQSPQPQQLMHSGIEHAGSALNQHMQHNHSGDHDSGDHHQQASASQQQCGAAAAPAGPSSPTRALPPALLRRLQARGIATQIVQACDTIISSYPVTQRDAAALHTEQPDTQQLSGGDQSGAAVRTAPGGRGSNGCADVSSSSSGQVLSRDTTCTGDNDGDGGGVDDEAYHSQSSTSASDSSSESAMSDSSDAHNDNGDSDDDDGDDDDDDDDDSEGWLSSDGGGGFNDYDWGGEVAEAANDDEQQIMTAPPASQVLGQRSGDALQQLGAWMIERPGTSGQTQQEADNPAAIEQQQQQAPGESGQPLSGSAHATEQQPRSRQSQAAVEAFCSPAFQDMTSTLVQAVIVGVQHHVHTDVNDSDDDDDDADDNGIDNEDADNDVGNAHKMPALLTRAVSQAVSKLAGACLITMQTEYFPGHCSA